MKMSRYMQPTLGLRAQMMQTGFTLIELLVVIVLSSFMAIAIAKMVGNNVRISNLTEDSSQTSERTKLAVHTLSRHIRLAGFPNAFQADFLQSSSYPPSIVFNSDDARWQCPQGNNLVSHSCQSNASAGNGSPMPQSDTLAVEYDIPKVNAQNGDYTTCNGTSVKWGTGANTAKRIREVFTVYRMPGTSDYSLVCGSFSVNGTTVTSLVPTGATGLIAGNFAKVVEGISYFKVRYGMASNDEGVYVETNYAATIGRESTRKRIRAVRFALLVNTDRDTSGGKTPNSSYRIFNSNIDLQNAPGSTASTYRSVYGEVVLNNSGGQI